MLAFMAPGLPQIVIFLAIVLLLFGKRLPGAMRSLGMSFSAFKEGVKDGEENLNGPADDKDDDKRDA